MVYQFLHFKRSMLLADISFKSGPAPGEPFPDFDLDTTDGGRLTLEDLRAGGPTLMVLGSFT
ncbi:MAG: hypothetical protein ACR2GQ_05610 [Gemmatimonadota bacterium]